MYTKQLNTNVMWNNICQAHSRMSAYTNTKNGGKNICMIQRQIILSGVVVVVVFIIYLFFLFFDIQCSEFTGMFTCKSHFVLEI